MFNLGTLEKNAMHDWLEANLFFGSDSDTLQHLWRAVRLTEQGKQFNMDLYENAKRIITGETEAAVIEQCKKAARSARKHDDFCYWNYKK